MLNGNTKQTRKPAIADKLARCFHKRRANSEACGSDYRGSDHFEVVFIARAKKKKA